MNINFPFLFLFYFFQIGSTLNLKSHQFHLMCFFIFHQRTVLVNISYALCWTICGQKWKGCQLNWSYDILDTCFTCRRIIIVPNGTAVKINAMINKRMCQKKKKIFKLTPTDNCLMRIAQKNALIQMLV